MASRQATDTIRGYLYQFDYTIRCLLTLENHEDAITIEGIEDVDITDESLVTAVQCKYYSKTEYNHSVIGKPIRLMLQDFKNRLVDNEDTVDYKLYGHFKSGQHKLSIPIDLIFLKEELLTYSKDSQKITEHELLELNDVELEVFLNSLTIDINAAEYHEQYYEINELLMKHFNCDYYTAEHYYYNNALKVIKDYSTLNKEEDRKITKKQFISKIDNKEILFNKWFILFKGKQNFFKELNEKHFSTLNVSPFDRFFLIEVNNHNYSRSDLKHLLLKISQKWSQLSKRSNKPFCPYIFLFNIDSSELMSIKREFIEEDIKFIDGFPFHGADFTVESITIQPNHNNGIQLKIINDISNLPQILSAIKNTKEIYQFYLTDPYFEPDDKFIGVRHLKIQVEDMNDIGEII